MVAVVIVGVMCVSCALHLNRSFPNGSVASAYRFAIFVEQRDLRHSGAPFTSPSTMNLPYSSVPMEPIRPRAAVARGRTRSTTRIASGWAASWHGLQQGDRYEFLNPFMNIYIYIYED